jgi:predicted MFS family arabinose efflux permease
MKFQARLREQIGLFASTRMVLNMGTRMVYPFLAAFARGLGVDVATLSLAITARSLAGAFSPFITPLADKHGRKLSMLLGIGMSLAGFLLVTVFPVFWAFVACLIVNFLGMYVYMSTMQAHVGDIVEYSDRGTALSLTEMGWALAFIFGMPVLGLLMQRFGWQAPFPFLAVLSVIAFFFILKRVPNTPPPAVNGSSMDRFKQVFSTPAAVAGLLTSLLLVASNESINLVFGLWMEDSFNLQLAALGFSSAVIGLAEISGEGSGALLVDRLGKKRAVYLGMGALLVVALALPYIGRNLVGALVGLFIFYLAYEFTFVATLPLMTEVLPEARATIMGLNVAALSLGRVLGTLIAPAAYKTGFWVNGLISAGLVLLAMLALVWLKVPEKK